MQPDYSTCVLYFFPHFCVLGAGAVCWNRRQLPRRTPLPLPHQQGPVRQASQLQTGLQVPRPREARQPSGALQLDRWESVSRLAKARLHLVLRKLGHLCILLHIKGDVARSLVIPTCVRGSQHLQIGEASGWTNTLLRWTGTRPGSCTKAQREASRVTSTPATWTPRCSGEKQINVFARKTIEAVTWLHKCAFYILHWDIQLGQQQTIILVINEQFPLTINRIEIIVMFCRFFI